MTPDEIVEIVKKLNEMSDQILTPSSKGKHFFRKVAALIESLEKEIEWRYSHDEIEASCGGETALEIRSKVVKRRNAIFKQSHAL